MDEKGELVGATIRDALQNLKHENRLQRSRARQVLVGMGDAALGDINHAIEDHHGEPSRYLDELIRTRDWILLSEDPEKLKNWMLDMDLYGAKHGNMLGGATHALRQRPGFVQLNLLGEQVRTYLESVIVDEAQSFCSRAGAVFLIGDLENFSTVPILVSALEAQCAAVSKPDSPDQLVLETPYQNLFIHALSKTLGDITKEHLFAGVVESIQGLEWTGGPITYLDLPLARAAIERWKRWWEFYGRSRSLDKCGSSKQHSASDLLDRFANEGNGQDSYARFALSHLGEQGDQAVAEFLHSCNAVTSVEIALFDMLLQNRKASLLPDDEKTKNLVDRFLGVVTNPIVLRRFINAAQTAVPVALVSALLSVIRQHPLATDYSHLFNPYGTVPGIDVHMVDSDKEIPDDVITSLLTGFAAEDHATKSLAMKILESISSVVPEAMRDRVVNALESQAEACTLFDRVETTRIIHRLGKSVTHEQSLGLLREATESGDKKAAHLILDILLSLEVPTDQRDAALQVLFRTARAFPDFGLNLLRCLDKVDKDNFEFSPVINADGVRALIALYELSDRPRDAEVGAEIGKSVRRLRECLKESMSGSMMNRILAARTLDRCIKIADKYGLAEELFDSLTLKAGGYSIGQSTVYAGDDARDYALEELSCVKSALPRKTLKALENVEDVTTKDVATGLFESAAHVAAANDLDEDRRLLALLSQADVSRHAKRYEQAEQLFCELEAETAGHLLFDARRQHFHSVLYIMTKRWSEAIKVATALRAVLAVKLEEKGDDLEPQVAAEIAHYYMDTILHEAECRLRMGEFAAAELLSGSAAAMYQKSRYQNHYCESLLFLASSQIELKDARVSLGENQSVEFTLQHLQEQLAGKREFATLMACALKCEAEVFLRKSEFVNAEQNLRESLKLRSHETYGEERTHGNSAEDALLLGKALLSLGHIDEARGLLPHFQGLRDSSEEALFVDRLKSAVLLSLGRIDEAMQALHSRTSKFSGPNFPDDKVDLCLDCHRLLVSVGKLDQAHALLDVAEEVASRAGHPWRIGATQLARVHTLIAEGRTKEARSICSDLLTDNFASVADISASARSYVLLLDCMSGEVKCIQPVGDQWPLLQSIRSNVLRNDLVLRLITSLLQEGAPNSARELVELASPEIERGMELDLLLRLNMLRGQIYAGDGQNELAVEEFTKCVYVFELMQSAGTLTGQQSGIWEVGEDVYGQLTECLLALGEKKRALHYVERSKARFMLAQMHWSSDSASTLGRPVVRYIEILRQLALMDLVDSDSKESSQEKERLNAELTNLRSELQEHELDMTVFPQLDEVDDLLGSLLQVTAS